MSKEEFKKALWEIVCREGIVITNQNIDWLIERVYKEVQE